MGNELVSRAGIRGALKKQLMGEVLQSVKFIENDENSDGQCFSFRAKSGKEIQIYSIFRVESISQIQFCYANERLPKKVCVLRNLIKGLKIKGVKITAIGDVELLLENDLKIKIFIDVLRSTLFLSIRNKTARIVYFKNEERVLLSEKSDENR